MSRQFFQNSYFILFSKLLLVIAVIPVSAQIVPDRTLGNERSVISPNVTIKGTSGDRIDGGAARGGNLFHSFSAFNVNEGQRVYFSLPNGIHNIFSRITGLKKSEILGTLGVLGQANLFLINPNGIIFGKNAKLDLGGSFLVTTANAIQFDSQGLFSATDPETPPLLTIDPSALLFTQKPIGTIVNQGSLKVPNQKSLLLIGGEVNFRGGSAIATDGRIELSAIADLGTVSLDPSFRLSVPETIPKADLSLSQKAKIDAGSGAIVITGRDITLTDSSTIAADIQDSQNGQRMFINASRLKVQDGSQITTTAKEKSQGNSGGLTINATEAVEVRGTFRGEQDRERPSKIASDAQGGGSAGDLIINTRNLRILDGGKITASTIDRPEGGSILVNALESVELGGAASQRVRSSSLSVQTRGKGKAGDITINTQRLQLQDGAEITASTFGTGDGGNIRINASELVEVTGNVRVGTEQLFSQIIAQTGEILNSEDAGKLQGTGNGGLIRLNTGRLALTEGGRLSASTAFTGNGGTIQVNAQNEIELAQGQITTFSRGSGEAGMIDLTAKQIIMSEQSSISSEAIAQGRANSIEINTDSLKLAQDSRITVSSPEGQAGNIEITARSLSLDQSTIAAETGIGQGEGGANIFLNLAENLSLLDGSSISANAFNNAKGGNVTINAQFIIATPQNNDITANAFKGQGGNIKITSQRIFGLENRAEPTNFSDITASSQFGLAGIVNIQRLDLDPTQNLVQLESNVVDVASLIEQNYCVVSRNSEFTVTGRGGLPSSPQDTLNSQAIWEDWRSINSSPKSEHSLDTQNQQKVKEIVQIQGWVLGANGEILLTAKPAIPTPQGIWLHPLDCRNLGLQKND